MDSCLAGELASFALLTPQRVLSLLRSEGPHYELTKALCNLAYNIVRVESLEPSESQKQIFEQYQEELRLLVSLKHPLALKQRLLSDNLTLTVAIAASCHR
jgi:hypothetical protein